MGIRHSNCAIFSAFELVSPPEEQSKSLRGALKKYKRPKPKTASIKDNGANMGSRPLKGAVSAAIALECFDTLVAKDHIPEKQTKKSRNRLNQTKLLV